MNLTLRKDADAIIASSLNAVLPDEAVRRALKAFAPKGGRVLLVAAGKAAWQMAHAAVEALGRVDGRGAAAFQTMHFLRRRAETARYPPLSAPAPAPMPSRWPQSCSRPAPDGPLHNNLRPEFRP